MAKKAKKDAEPSPVVEDKVKRGRKPKKVYNAEVASVVSQSSEEDNLIVCLSVKDRNNGTVDYYDDEVPYAYNHDYYTKISNVEGKKAQAETENQSQTRTYDDTRRNLKVVDILHDFKEKNKNNEWPSNTSIHCYWCCHKFNNAPFGIPINFENNKFEVFGCFCTLECAAAYNFKMNHNIDEMWERNNLINLLSRHIDYKSFVKPAPDRLCLKQFGGFMDIEEFRNHTNLNRVININFPPMTSVTQQLEEINENDLKNQLKYIPIDMERIKKYKEKILFKRNKPLVDNKISIESTMDLKYTS